MTSTRSWTRVYLNSTSIPFYLVHVAAVVGVAMIGWSWTGLAVAIGLYYARMFFVTAGYHRYFAHRSYKTSRAFQFLLALGGTTAAQKGVLWWAAHHRRHHKFSDQPGDVHSPVQDGFWYSHMGWILDSTFKETDEDRIRDFARYPELRWLQRHNMIPPILLAVGLFVAGGWYLLVWGFFVSTVLLWHGTFVINSLAHVFGRRRYETTDTSKNSLLLALITMGEGWHNNHHYYQRSASQGFHWYQIDISYSILRALQAVGVVRGVGRPPAHVVAPAAARASSATDTAPVPTRRAA